MRRWTPDEDDLVRRWTRNGVTVHEIAKELDRTYGAVKERRRTLGCTTRTPKQWTAGEDKYIVTARRSGRTAADIARDLGRTQRSVELRFAVLGEPAPNRVTDDEIRAAHDLRAEGWSTREIAQIMDRTPKTVIKMLRMPKQ